MFFDGIQVSHMAKTIMSLCNAIPVLFISLATTGFYLQKVNKLCKITKNGHFYWLKVLLYHSVQRLTALSQNCFPYSSSCIIIYHHVMILHNHNIHQEAEKWLAIPAKDVSCILQGQSNSLQITVQYSWYITCAESMHQILLSVLYNFLVNNHYSLENIIHVFRITLYICERFN